MTKFKEIVGPKELMVGVSMFLSILSAIVVILIAVGAPFAKQVEINTASSEGLKGLTKSFEDQKTEQAKALSEAVARIEAGIKQAVELSQQSLALSQQSLTETRSLRTSTEGQFVELRQDTKGLWKWATALDGKVGVLEAEMKTKKEK